MSGDWELEVTEDPCGSVGDVMVAPIQTWREEEGAFLCPCVMHDLTGTGTHAS